MKLLVLLWLIFLVLIIAFYLGLGIAGFFSKPKTIPESEKLRRFAVLIPARNEEKVIGNLIDSIRRQNYPQNKVDVYTVLNNSTDQTEEESIMHGASVLKCKGTIQGKGDALNEAFNTLQVNDKYDIYTILDADNIVHPDFLKYTNDMVNQGYQIVQGRRNGKNAEDNIISGIYVLFYSIQNEFFNNVRHVLKHSAALNGTGWSVTSNWIKENGYHPFTMTEDLEMTAIAALKGTKIAYCDRAITYDEYPNTLKKVKNQLFRWVFGQVQCMRKYTKSLFESLLRNASFEVFDIMWIFLFPVIGCIGLIMAVLIFRNKELLLIGELMCSHPYLSFLLVYIVLMIPGIMAVSKCCLSISQYLFSVLLFPVFLIFWFPVSQICIFRKSVSWTEVKHDRDISIEEML